MVSGHCAGADAFSNWTWMRIAFYKYHIGVAFRRCAQDGAFEGGQVAWMTWCKLHTGMVVRPNGFANALSNWTIDQMFCSIHCIHSAFCRLSFSTDTVDYGNRVTYLPDSTDFHFECLFNLPRKSLEINQFFSFAMEMVNIFFFFIRVFDRWSTYRNHLDWDYTVETLALETIVGVVSMVS